MAKAEYWQKGSAIDYTNATATRIEANEIVPLTTRIGIAGMPIEAGATGTLLVEGVFILPLKSGESDAVKIGEALYFKDGEVTTTASGAVPCGWAIESTDAASTTIKVKLLG